MKELPSKYLEEEQLWVYHSLSTIWYTKPEKAKQLTHLAAKPDQSSHVLLIVFILLSVINQLFRCSFINVLDYRMLS